MGSKASKLLEESAKQHTKELSLREVGLKHVPMVICTNFQYITKLNLSDNVIKDIPAEIYRLRSLRIFWISNNKIPIVPDEVGLLSDLEDFQIDGNILTKIGIVFFELKKISEISLSRNQLKEIPVDISCLTSLKTLHLENNNLTAIPGCLQSLTQLRTLNVGQNSIEYIFNDFVMLPALSNLSIFANKLTLLPDNFGKLHNLVSLNLRSNRLTSLPDSFSLLSNLTTISLWDNQFTEFPLALCQCRSLVELSFSNNSIGILPSEIGQLKTLEKLYLQYNQIEIIPREIRYLSKLAHLLLHHNKITSLPCEIGIIPHLETMNLVGNPLPSKLMSMDLQSLSKHLRSEFQVRQDISARIIQRHYKIWKKQFKFRSLVMMVIQEKRNSNQQILINRMSNILSSVIKIQRFYRSFKIRTTWRNLITKILLFHHTTSNSNNSNFNNIGNIIFGFDVPDLPENILYYKPSDQMNNINHSNSDLIIKGASLTKLIEKLTDQSYKEKDFLKYFFTSYQSFTDALEIFKLLCIRYHIEPTTFSNTSNSLKEFYKIIKPRIQERVLELMEYWIKNHLSDFQDNPKLLKSFNSFLTTTLLLEKETSAKRLIALFNETKKKHSDQLMELIKLSQNAPKPILPLIKPPENQTYDILNLSTVEIARQMALIDQTLLSKITSSELLSKKWSSQTPESLRICPNILNMISIFNHCSQWVASEIVSEKSSKIRVKKLKFFIKIAQHCFDMRNFNGLMLVISGLSCSSVTKLKGTWAALSNRRREKFDQLEKFVNMEGNFKLYRVVLSEVYEQPCIPFVGLYLMDLTFIDEGNPPYLDDKDSLINFVKKRLEANIILRFTSFKNFPYFFESVPFIQDMILNSIPLTEKDLYERSVEIEKRHLRKIKKKENKERKLASSFGDLTLLANPLNLSSSSGNNHLSSSGSNSPKKSRRKPDSSRSMIKKGDVLTTSSPAILSPTLKSSNNNNNSSVGGGGNSIKFSIDLSSLSQNSTPNINNSSNSNSSFLINSGSVSPRNRLIASSSTYSSLASIGSNSTNSPLSSPRGTNIGLKVSTIFTNNNNSNPLNQSTTASTSSSYSQSTPVSIPNTPTSLDTPTNPFPNSMDLLLNSSTTSANSFSNYHIHNINF